MTTGCVFCRILAGEVPASVVLEADLVVAFLDIRPANSRHMLVQCCAAMLICSLI